MKQKSGRKLLSFLLTLVLVLGLVPGMSLTAFAESTTVMWNNNDITTSKPWESTFTKGGVTVTAGRIDFNDKNFMDGGTFTTTLGNFTKIQITGMEFGNPSGTGWSGTTWTGNASSVPFSGDIYGAGEGNLKFVFTIEPPTVNVTSISLDPATADMTVGGETLTLTPTVLPDNATDKSVTWTSSDPNVATVADGVVTAVAAGTVTITATANDGSGVTGTCEVTVTDSATPTETLLTTITATGQEQASYSTESVATVSFSYSQNGSSSYLDRWGWWGYGWTATVAPTDGYTITKCVFYDDANRTATDSEAPFVVETTEEDKTPQVNGTPILANQSKGIKKIEVYGFATPAPAAESTYTITIPSALTVANSGWNATDGISATGALASGKKLTVTAASANSWALKSGENSVGYKLATASTDTEATTSWTFDSLSDTATKKDMGIIVDDYSEKPAGTYTDTVTFTAAVEDGLKSLTIRMSDIEDTATIWYNENETWGQAIANHVDKNSSWDTALQAGSDYRVGYMYKGLWYDLCMGNYVQILTDASIDASANYFIDYYEGEN